MLTLPKRFLISTAIYKQPAPVTLDDTDDELLQAIIDDKMTHDDDWQLEERPDTSELERFWTRVEDDLSRDPQWVRFSEDEG